MGRACPVTLARPGGRCPAGRQHSPGAAEAEFASLQILLLPPARRPGHTDSLLQAQLNSLGTQGPDPEHATTQAHLWFVCVRVCVAGRRPTPCSSLEVQMAQRRAARVTSSGLVPCWSHSLGEGVGEADLCRPHPSPEHPSAAGTQPPSSISRPGSGV